MGAVREALEALGHPQGAPPHPHRLAELFVRFQAQVPLRRAPERLDPERTLAAWLEEGAGCCGEVRVRAFEALGASAGFLLERGHARSGGGAPRSVLLAPGGSHLLDPAFPLPAPLSLDPPVEAEVTGYGSLSTRPAPGGGSEVRLETRGDERLLFRVAPGERPPGEEREAGESGEPLFRLLEDRLVRWRDGVLEVSDAWSRLRLPFPASDSDGLEALFGPPVPDQPACAVRAGALEPTLAAYHAVAADVPRLLRLLRDPEVHAAFLPEGWDVEGLSTVEGGFRRTLVEEGELLRSERAAFLPDGVAVAADGPLALFRTRTWRLEPRPFGTRLRLLATLRDPVPPRGLPEGARRRLVFELASELLALERLASGT